MKTVISINHAQKCIFLHYFYCILRVYIIDAKNNYNKALALESFLNR